MRRYLSHIFVCGLLLTALPALSASAKHISSASEVASFQPLSREEPLKVGVLAFRPKEQALEMWQPLGEYLQQQLERRVVVATYTYPELEEAISHNRLDVVLTNPAHYILLRYRNGLSAPLATQITKRDNRQLTAFGGVIFTRANMNNINGLSDIIDKRVAVTKLESLGGYKMQAFELLTSDLPLPDSKNLITTGMPHDRVVEEVLSGKADIGFVRTGVLESLVDEGKLNLTEIKVINRQALAFFPYLASTRLYPEWPVAVMPNVKEVISRKLTAALVSLQGDSPAAMVANIYGFTTPANYDGVEALLRKMRVEPFNTVPVITFEDLWQRYTQWIVVSSVFTLVLIGFGILLVIQNRHIHRTKVAIDLSEQRLKNVIEGAELGYWDWEYQTGKQIVNSKWLSMLGLSAEDTRNNVSDWEERIHPLDKAVVLAQIEASIKADSSYVCEFRMRHADGHWVWIQGAGAVVERDKASGVPLRLCGTHQDISDRKAQEEKVKLISRVFSDTHEGVSITDVAGNIIDVNPAFCEITGFSREEVIGQNPRVLNSKKQSPEFYIEMWQSIIDQGHWQGEVWNRKKSGELYAQLLTISSLQDDSGKTINYIGVFTDITHTKQQQEKLSLMAHYDLLTGLPNRTLFADRFHQAIAHSKRTKRLLAICFLDLDNFKPVNDRYGHDVGDQLLIDVAQRISASIREEDTVSRQGGDEFTLLLNDIDSIEHCEHTIERILHSLAQPHFINDSSYEISVSIGITLYPDDDGDVDTLIRHADNAMYQAKLSGKSCYRFYDRQHDLQLLQKNLRLDEIRQGLQGNQFHLYYQPKVNMITGKVFGVEALIRWIHPEKGVIPPLDFLPLIDGSELELEVGDWVMDEALRQAEYWQTLGINLEVSINIASCHLQSASFIKNLEAALERYPSVNPSALQLEILESSVLSDLGVVSEIIKTCQNALGVNVALDDFGTGYSSLTHLRSLSANTIKIDQSFVRDMLEDPDDYTIIDGVIGLAHAFDREVIAEGVETIEHGLMLLVMGCELIQGYAVAKPMPAAELPEWLNAYTPNPKWLLCGSEERTEKESQIQQLRLITDYWQSIFVAKLQSTLEDDLRWPVMLKRNDHCGQWIKRAKRGHLFEKKFLNRIEEIYDECHQKAEKLRTQYENGEVEIVREGLAHLYTVFEKFTTMIDQCE